MKKIYSSIFIFSLSFLFANAIDFGSFGNLRKLLGEFGSGGHSTDVEKVQYSDRPKVESVQILKANDDIFRGLMPEEINPLNPDLDNENFPMMDNSIVSTLMFLRSQVLLSKPGPEIKFLIACKINGRCVPLGSRGVPGAVPRAVDYQLTKKLAELTSNFKDVDFVIDLHGHPVNDFTRENKLSESVRKVINYTVDRESFLLTGPSGPADCKSKDQLRSFGNVSLISIVADAGGFWLCTDSLASSDLLTQAKDTYKLRGNLITGSQDKDKSKRNAAIKKFELDTPKVMGLKVKFLEYKISESRLKNTIWEFLNSN